MEALNSRRTINFTNAIHSMSIIHSTNATYSLRQGGHFIRRCLILLPIMMLCWFFSFSTAFSSPAAFSKDKLVQIDEEITQNMQRFNIPGMAFVLANENGIVYAKGYGLQGQGGDQPVDAATNFQIGSISKVFTSLAIMQLRDEGLIQLDAPVTNYLPWFTTEDTSLSDLITIHDLLNHTSGLPGRLNTHDVKSSDADTIAVQIKRKLQKVQLVASPGTTYEYTNMNYDLLQLIIEKVSGQSFPDYMNHYIFQPLDMNRTSFSREAGLDNSATGHRYIWGELRPFHEQPAFATLGSAGLATNAEDLGAYISFLLTSSAGVDSSVLRSESLHEMHTAVISDHSIGYGFGWEITANTVEKKGGLPGFTANLIVLPGKSYGFALLANSKQNITDETNFNIARILEGASPGYLANDDFPTISLENKLILYISAFLTLIALLMWLPVVFGPAGKKGGFCFVKPSLPAVLICFVLNGFVLVSVLYYIYIYVPYESGVPALHRLTTAPDTVNGLMLLSGAWLSCSLSLACRSVLRQNKRLNRIKDTKI